MRGTTLAVDMFEGSEESTDEAGRKVKKSGILFGNGFAYGETVRAPNGVNIVSKVEYLLRWEDGQLHLKKVVRIDANTDETFYCDLEPIQP